MKNRLQIEVLHSEDGLPVRQKGGKRVTSEEQVADAVLLHWPLKVSECAAAHFDGFIHFWMVLVYPSLCWKRSRGDPVLCAGAVKVLKRPICGNASLTII